MRARQRSSLGSGAFEYRKSKSTSRSEELSQAGETGGEKDNREGETRKRGGRTGLHARVGREGSENERFRRLVQLILREHLDGKMGKATEVQRKEFEKMGEEVVEYLRGCEGGEESGGRITDMEEGKNEEVERQIEQLEEVERKYEAELERWEAVKAEVEKHGVNVACVEEAEMDVADDNDATNEVITDGEQLGSVCKEAMEWYIVKTDDMRTKVKELESRNRDTDGRIRAIAGALTSRVMREVGHGENDATLLPRTVKKIKLPQQHLV